MSLVKENLVTVQGVGNPVPAEGSEQAGSQQSRSSNCNVTTVANLADVTDMSTSEERGSTKSVHGDRTPTNPFGRSALMQRSPKKGAMTGMLERCFSSPSLGRDKEETKEILLTRLGKKIEELVEYVKPRNNVHSEIKKMISTISTLYGSAITKRNVLEKQCQTSPINNDGKENLARLRIVSRKQELEKATNEDTPLVEPSKRKLFTPPKSDESRQSKKRNTKAAPQSNPQNVLQAPRMAETLISNKDGNKKPNTTTYMSDNGEINATGSNQLKDALVGSEQEWQKVKAKRRPKKRTRPRRKRARPDALLIKKSDEISFADLLRKVKVDPTLNTLGERVSNIRQTHSGDLLLELQTTGDQPKTAIFREQLAEAIGSSASVKALIQEALLVIKDMDEVTTSEEVKEALEAQFEGVKGVCNVKSLTKAYRGTQTAVVSLPNTTIAGKVLEVGKVRIGWVSCRIREKIELTRCFKCHGYGHRSWNCRSETDRSKLCRRCGEEGHFAKTCQENSKCMLCDETAKGCSKHVTGSVRCPAYQKALQIERWK